MEKTVGLLNEDIGFVYSRVYMHHHNQQTTIGLKHPPYINPMNDIVEFLLRTPLTISPGCAVFRRSDAINNLLLEIPSASGRYGKNSGVGEDLLLFLLTSLSYSYYGHVNVPLVHFLAHPQSITTSSAIYGHRKELEDAYAVAKEYYLKCPGSISKPALKINRLLSEIKWKYRSGTLLRALLNLTIIRELIKRIRKM